MNTEIFFKMHSFKSITCCIVLFFMLISFAAFSQSEEIDFKKNFPKVNIGMSELQVKKLVGNPEMIEHFKTLKIGTTDTTTYWRYEQDFTIIFKNHVVEEIEKNHNALLQRIQDWANPKNKDGIKLLYK